MMKCSVIVAAYNGEKYIRRQLESLLLQSRQPDEVVIADDGSKDRTCEIVRQFLTEKGISGWRLIQNEKNLGWKANFMKNTEQLFGDLIFFCDQDDWWEPEKILCMERIVRENPEICVLACDYEEIYETGAVKSPHYHKKETRKEGAVVKYPLTSRFFMNPRPGCTYAVRKEFLEKIRSGWKEDFPHDEYIWIAAAFSGGAYLLNRKLVLSYRHAENASAIHFKDLAMQKKQAAYISSALRSYQELMETGKLQAVPGAEELLKGALLWCQKRQKLLESRNLLRWFLMARSWKYYNSVKNSLSDPVLVLFGKFTRRRIR